MMSSQNSVKIWYSCKLYAPNTQADTLFFFFKKKQIDPFTLIALS
jgi:hypothetical protein